MAVRLLGESNLARLYDHLPNLVSLAFGATSSAEQSVAPGRDRFAIRSVIGRPEHMARRVVAAAHQLVR